MERRRHFNSPIDADMNVGPDHEVGASAIVLGLVLRRRGHVIIDGSAFFRWMRRHGQVISGVSVAFDHGNGRVVL